MTRGDSLVLQDIIAELQLDPRTGPLEVGVAVRGGVATLSGTLESEGIKGVVLRAARRVAGVQAIADELRVLPAHGVNRTDTEIAHAVINALNWEREVPRDRITARVDEGCVWLDGELDSEREKAAAERAVSFVKGVRSVTNSIRVTGSGSG